MTERTNEQWLADLQSSGSAKDAALDDLGGIVRSSLPYALSKWLSPSDPQFDALADEVVQDTLLRVMDNLHTFEGRSKFTTWVYKIAVRIALTDLRRKRWQDVSLDEMVEGEESPSMIGLMADTSDDPESAAERSDLMEHLQRVIESELTDKQRTALVAIGIQGMPMDVVAERMGMNRNALYKLMHDARLKLKKSLVAEGLDPQDFMAAYEDG